MPRAPTKYPYRHKMFAANAQQNDKMRIRKLLNKLEKQGIQLPTNIVQSLETKMSKIERNSGRSKMNRELRKRDLVADTFRMEMAKQVKRIPVVTSQDRNMKELREVGDRRRLEQLVINELYFNIKDIDVLMNIYSITDKILTQNIGLTNQKKNQLIRTNNWQNCEDVHRRISNIKLYISQLSGHNLTTLFNGGSFSRSKKIDILNTLSTKLKTNTNRQSKSNSPRFKILQIFENLKIPRSQTGEPIYDINDLEIYVTDLFYELTKDVSIFSALYFFIRNVLGKNQNKYQRMQQFKAYLNSLGNVSRKQLKQIFYKIDNGGSVDYEKAKYILDIKTNVSVGGIRKNIYALNLNPLEGPANHNILSNRALQNILNNPTILEDGVSQNSLFLKELLDALNARGFTSGKCGGFRGTLDTCLLRRRVVFNLKEPTEVSMLFLRVLMAMNHGRMHVMKTMTNNGNKSVGVPKKMQTADDLRKYIKAMSSGNIRNVPNMFFSNSNLIKNNALYYSQVDLNIHVPIVLKNGRIEVFQPTFHIEKPNILWTSYGLLNSKNKQFRDIFKIFGLSSTKTYVIQLDTNTLNWINERYYFRNMDIAPNQPTFYSQIVQKCIPSR